MNSSAEIIDRVRAIKLEMNKNSVQIENIQAYASVIHSFEWDGCVWANTFNIMIRRCDNDLFWYKFLVVHIYSYSEIVLFKCGLKHLIGVWKSSAQFSKIVKYGATLFLCIIYNWIVLSTSSFFNFDIYSTFSVLSRN